MKILGKKIAIAFLLILCLGQLQAQKIWGEVHLDRSSTFVGQAVEVRINAYTSTWFTRGLDIGNIKVNGAFTVYFRPVSLSKSLNGQTYAGVELIYHLFPFSDKDIVFPALEIEVETPAEGDYKGKKRIIKTAEKRIRVKPIPASFDKREWLVANGLTVSEHWAKPLTTVKVGDVFERRISRYAEGTVSELIPPIVWDSTSGLSLYPSRSKVENHKTKTAISAERVESIRYLFEKEGELVLPEMVFSWYNPYHQKLYKKTIKAITIDVQANPNQGVLATVRDSLKSMEPALAESQEEEANFSILGYSLKEFVVGVLLLFIAVFVFLYLVKRLFNYIRSSWKSYRHSESYYFNQLKKAVKKNDYHLAVNALYRWIDELELKEPSVHFFLAEYSTDPALEEFNNWMESIKSSDQRLKLNLKCFKQARGCYLRREREQNNTEKLIWVNPRL